MSLLSRTRTSGPLGLMLLFALVLGPWAALQLFDALPWLFALVLVAGFVALTVGLSVHAVRRPAYAGKLISVCLALLATYGVVFAQMDRVPASVGPLVSLGLLGIGVALSFLGATRPRSAGWMLFLAGLVPLLDLLLFTVIHGGANPGNLALLGPAGGVTAALWLTAGLALARAARGIRRPIEPGLDDLHPVPL